MATEPSGGGPLRRRIFAIGAFVIAALVGSAVYDSWQLHTQLEIINHRELSNLAQALANEAKRNLQSVDILLKDTANWYRESDAGSRLSASQIQQELSARASGVPQVSVLTLVDAVGRQKLRSRETGEPLADVSDRPYFVAQRDLANLGLYINEPIVTRSERRPALVLSRRLNHPDGTFAGAIVAAVTLDTFQDMYSALQLNEGSSLLLTLKDGTLVARVPTVPGLVGGVKRPEIPEFVGGSLVDRVISPVDGRAKLVVALPVGELPLVMGLTRDEYASLAPWYEAMFRSVVRTALLSFLIVFTMYRLLRQLEKVESGERALRESEERYAMTMDATEGGHAEWNLAKDTLFLSDKWRALHGVPPGTALHTVRDVMAAVPVHEEDRLPVQQAIEQHLAGKTPSIEIEYRVLHPGNQWRWIHARAKSSLDAHGAPARIFCAAIDGTERREALSARFELERRLQQNQRLESLGMLAGGIAHDFNNILGAILGFGEMARQKTQAGSDLHRYLDRVLQAGDRARLLVRHILDFSRSGVAECVPVHIQSVVEESIAMLMPTVPAGVVLQTELTAGHAAVMGDATQLYQTVTNLCTNALQALGERGTVRVRLTKQDVQEARLLAHGSLVEGRYVCLEVQDTGSGMAPEVVQSMFNPFFTTKKGNQGTGLGLSVVHGVVADHGGALDVVSEPGVGTTMSVWLPSHGDYEGDFEKIRAVPVQGQGQTIMVVDDEVALVELAEERLAYLGYEPVGFHTAEAALAAFSADPDRFDALLSDEMLPGMAGTELAERVRAIRPGLPVFIMSGKVTVDLEERVHAVGADMLLRKPLQISDIAGALSRLAELERENP